MKKTERTIYNYLLPRKKRELANYVHALIGIPALLLFVWSFYLGLTEPPDFLLLAMGYFFSRPFINSLWSYFKYENILICIAIEPNGVGYGFKHNEIEWWLFMDGVYALDLEEDDWWVIRHVNGTMIHFPNGLLSEEDMEILKNKIEIQKEEKN